MDQLYPENVFDYGPDDNRSYSSGSDSERPGHSEAPGNGNDVLHAVAIPQAIRCTNCGHLTCDDRCGVNIGGPVTLCQCCLRKFVSTQPSSSSQQKSSGSQSASGSNWDKVLISALILLLFKHS